MKTFRIIIAIFTLGFITSCGEDFLDLTPIDAIADVEAFETLEDFNTGLNGIYSSIRGGGAYWGKHMMMNHDVAVDDLYAVQGFTNQWGSLYAWNLNAGTGEVSDVWLTAYRVATRSSNLINSIDNLNDEDPIVRNQILGEAKLARALAHFDLVRIYARPYRLANRSDLGIPIVTVENLLEKPRNTIGEVYDFILEEALEAQSLITQSRARHYFGVDAANAFLARVYHEMGDWTNAITYASNVIAARDLSPRQEFFNIWQLNDGREGDEVIFLVGVHQTEFGNALNLGSNFVGGNPPVGGNWRIDYIPSLSLLALYDTDDDIRYQAYFLDNVNVPTIEPITAFVKYPPENELFANRGMNQMKVFRVAEAYLVRMEAYAQSGQANLANQDLAALRTARINNYTHTDLAGADLLDAIYEERRKEMVGESSRWFDLRRRGVGFTRTPQQGTGPSNDLSIAANDFRWIWPIPQGEMDANGNMVQNPGYTAE